MREGGREGGKMRKNEGGREGGKMISTCLTRQES